MDIPNYDVVIGGAGPAGCATAIRLRQLGVSVCIIDAIKPNTLKVGESLPGATLRLLRRLGISDLSQLLPPDAYAACTANISAWGTEKWTYNDAIRNPETGGWHIVRHKFDAALRTLAQQQGVAIYSGKVGRIIAKKSNTNGTHYHLYFKTAASHLPEYIQSQWLVDATGRSSHILKQFSVERLHYQSQLAAVAWLKTPNTDVSHATRIKSVAQGWWYSARLPDASRVLAFYGLPDTVAAMVKTRHCFTEAANASKLLEFSIQEVDLLEAVAACKAGISNSKSAIGNQWIAVGDAALALDPISSQGLFFAMYSGIRGAETIFNTLQHQSDAQCYKNDYQQKITSVFQANQNAQQHYYSAELRYTHEAYWQQYFKINVAIE